jgi:hypothetical protein
LARIADCPGGVPPCRLGGEPASSRRVVDLVHLSLLRGGLAPGAMIRT